MNNFRVLSRLFAASIFAAVLSCPLQAAPIPLSDSGELAAGSVPPLSVTEGKAAEVFSGIEALFYQKQYDKIIEKARKVLAEDPDSVAAYEILGTVFTYQNRLAKAATVLEKATSLDPDNAALLTRQGIVLMELGRTEAAEQVLAKATRLAPNYRYAHQRLGLLYEYSGDVERAIFHFQQGLEDTSDVYVGVAANLGRLLNKTQRFAETIALLEPRLAFGTANPAEAHLVLADAYMRQNQPEQAQAQFEKWLGKHPESQQGMLGLAMALRQAGEPESALATIEVLTQSHPRWMPGLVEQAEIHLAMRDADSASQVFDRARSQGLPALDIRKRLARYHQEQGDNRQAIVLYQQTIGDGLADADTYARLSELQLSEHQTAAAEKSLRRGAEALPQSAYVHLRLGSLVAATGRYQEALQPLGEASRLAPKDPVILRTLVLAQARAGEVELSATTARNLALLYPDNADFSFLYGTRLQALGRWREAESQYRKTIKSVPQHAPSLNNLADLLSAQGQSEEAEVFARQAVEAGGGGAVFLDTLGWIQYQQGAFRDAVESLRAAAQADKTNPVIQYHLGMALLDSGYAKEGRTVLEKAIELGGEAGWVKEARQRLN